MVSSGQAFAYRKYRAACDGTAYLGAEATAQRQRVGVWAVPGGGANGRGIGARSPDLLQLPMPPSSSRPVAPQKPAQPH